MVVDYKLVSMAYVKEQARLADHRISSSEQYLRAVSANARRSDMFEYSGHPAKMEESRLKFNSQSLLVVRAEWYSVIDLGNASVLASHDMSNSVGLYQSG